MLAAWTVHFTIPDWLINLACVVWNGLALASIILLARVLWAFKDGIYK